MRSENTSRYFLATLLIGVALASSARAEPLPKVLNVEFQPLSAQIRRVAESLEVLGQPLPAEAKAALEKAYAIPNPAQAVRALQEALDPSCLIGVEINPESRVKALQGEAKAVLTQQGWRVFLVKVQNDAGVTAEVVASSPNAAPLYKPSTNSPSPKVTVPLSEIPQRWMDLVIKQFVAQILLCLGRTRGQARHPVDHIAGQVESIQII